MTNEQPGARTAHAASLRLLCIGQIITLAPAKPDDGPLKLVNLLGLASSTGAPSDALRQLVWHVGRGVA